MVTSNSLYIAQIPTLCEDIKQYFGSFCKFKCNEFSVVYAYVYFTAMLSLSTITSCPLCQQDNYEELPRKNFRCFVVVFQERMICESCLHKIIRYHDTKSHLQRNWYSMKSLVLVSKTVLVSETLAAIICVYVLSLYWCISIRKLPQRFYNPVWLCNYFLW